jgi:hypothetical protein
VDGRVVSSDVVLVFIGFSRIFLLWIIIFKGLTARRLYKSLGVKALSKYRRSIVTEPPFVSDMTEKYSRIVLVNMIRG